MLLRLLTHAEMHVALVLDYSPLVITSPEFEHRQGEEFGQHLAHRLAQAFRNDVSVNLKSLLVIPGTGTSSANPFFMWTPLGQLDVLLVRCPHFRGSLLFVRVCV